MPSAAPRRLALRGPGRLLAALGLGLGVGLLLATARGTRAVSVVEGQGLDLRTRHFAGAQPPADDIVVVQIEDSDVEEVQRDLAIGWPWPLTVERDVCTLLADVGVKALVVDVLQLDAGAGPDDVAGRREGSAVDEAEMAGEAEMAVEYAQALRRVGMVALAFQLDDEPRYDAPARREAAAPRLATDGVRARPGGLARRGANLPVRRVAEGAARLGFANTVTDADGVVRRAHLAGRWGEREVPSLALAAALLLRGPGAADAQGNLLVDGRPLATEADGSFLVDFRAPRRAAAYRRLAPAKLLQWHLEAQKAGAPPAEARAALAGKIVVWGVNLTGADDLVATPIDGAYDGPELQATILDNLLHGGGRVRASPGLNLAWLLVVCGLTGLVTLGSRRKHLPHLVALLLLGAVVGVAFLAFARGTALDLFLPLLGVVLTWGGGTAVKLLTEGRYNRWLEGTFSLYLAPTVIDALKSDPGRLDLGGATRDVTVLFSDVAGFTTLSERLTPAQVVELLNCHLTAHCDAVFAEGGVVDKFIGDAVMAFWNDPLPQPDHAVRACTAALAVQAGMPTLEPVWRAMGLDAFHVRIGLNTGPAVLGNMGSKQRFSYTAMGDTVNLASRLEGANKAFGSSILIGGPTYEAARDAVLAKPLGRLVVVGKDEPVPVYELVALRSAARPEQLRHVEAFARAQEAARAGDLAAARTALAEALALQPGDGPSAWFGALLDKLASGAEPTPWSGVVSLSSK